MTIETRPRLILHPGHPKCGSSSIQRALLANRASMLARGVFIPVRRPNRVFIEASRRADTAAAEGWLNELVEAATRAGAETVVLSAENLGTRMMVTEGRRVHDLLAERFQVTSVIHYIRRQDDWMVSMWQQWGHQLGLGLPEFVDARLALHEPDFLKAVRLFQEVYGHDRIEVVIVDSLPFEGRDLIADFGNRAGLGPLPVTEANRRKNVSMGSSFCDVLARIPQVYDQQRASRFAEGITDHSVKRLLERSVESRDLLLSGEKRLLTPEHRRRIMKHFDSDNHVLHEEFFRHVRFDDVFGVPPRCPDEDLSVLRDQIEGLRDVMAIQMELLLNLLRKRERMNLRQAIKRMTQAWRKRS